MAVLYGTSIAWGVGSGIWIDGLANAGDPGIAFIAPLALGAAAPIGVYLWDNYDEFDRGVPSSMATGLALGAVEGIAISGTQWQHSGQGGAGTWSFSTQATLTWAISTGGGVGGYAFGEWLKPDPRSLAFIASGAGWGAISGSFIGGGAASTSFGDGASIGGLVGYNAGIVVNGAISTFGYVAFVALATSDVARVSPGDGRRVSRLPLLHREQRGPAPRDGRQRHRRARRGGDRRGAHGEHEGPWPVVVGTPRFK